MGLVVPLNPHSDWIAALCCTSDGRRVISASADTTLRVWDVQSGELIHVLAGHTARVTSMCLTPDNRQLVSSSNDSTMRLWDMQSGELIRVFTGHTSSINTVCLTPDGNRAVSASARTLRVWDLQSGEVIHVLADHERYITCMYLTSGGRQAISSDAFGYEVRLWDIEKGTLIQRVMKSGTGVRPTPDGKYVIIMRDEALLVCTMQSSDPIYELEGQTRPLSEAWLSPDGQLAASTSLDGTLRI